MTAGPDGGTGSVSDVLLSDGTIAAIRPLRPEDRPAVEALHEGVSTASTRFRFFTAGRGTGERYVEHLFSPGATEIALVVLLGGRVVALGTAERTDAVSAEVAFLVADDLHGHGIGSLLLEHLAAAGRDRGLRRFTAQVLTDNLAMVGVFRAAGFATERVSAHGVTDVAMSTAASDAAVEAADARESRAEARSLAGLLRPRRVAVVGVGRDGAGIGAAVLASILDAGFTGEVVVVHPDPGSLTGVTGITGVAAYAHLVDVPGHVDVVVVAVPARRVLGVVADAALSGAGTVVVLSSGFAEAGAAGETLRRDLVRLACDHSLRLAGPHSLGVQVHDPQVRLNATFCDLVPRAGGLAVATQSGGVGVALLQAALRSGLGLHSLVSLGDKADVSGNDLLAAWLDDPSVTAAALHLESFGNAPKLARLARRFSERKPLLVVLGGRSVVGRRGGARPTAAPATATIAVDALCGQSGIIACRDVDALVETALLLAEQPLPSGRRVAVVTNAGGMGVLAADAADAAGLVVPLLTEHLRVRLRDHAPGPIGTANPVDVGAAATPEALTQVVGALLGSGEVDALLVVLVATRVAPAAPLTAAVAAARAHHRGRPVLLVVVGAVPDPTPAGSPGVTRMPGLAAAVEALARVGRYAAWLAVPRCPPPPDDLDRARAARQVAAALLAVEGSEGWLGDAGSARLLQPYGLAPHAATGRGDPVASGVAMALGLVQDPTFGPLVVVAAGGTAAEVRDDRVVLLPPLDAGTVRRALRSLCAWPQLEGSRGAPRVDVDALERRVLALGQLGTDVPEVAELEVDPLLVDATDAHPVEVRVRLAPATPLDRGVPRRLRRPG